MLRLPRKVGTNGDPDSLRLSDIRHQCDRDLHRIADDVEDRRGPLDVLGVPRFSLLGRRTNSVLYLDVLVARSDFVGVAEEPVEVYVAFQCKAAR